MWPEARTSVVPPGLVHFVHLSQRWKRWASIETPLRGRFSILFHCRRKNLVLTHKPEASRLALYLALLVIIASAPGISAGTTYYVSSTGGNDANEGRAKASPWRTIARVNRQALSPGDFVLFRRGDLWRETLRPVSSGSDLAPITFGAYGRGAQPVIAGSDLVPPSSWKREKAGPHLLSGLAKPASVWRAGNRLPEVPGNLCLREKSGWCWLASQLYLWSDSGPPSDIEVQVRDVNIDNNEQSHIVYQDLALQHARQGLRLYAWSATVHDVTLENSSVTTEPSLDHGSVSAGVYASVHTGRFSGITIRNNNFVPYPDGLRHWGVYFVKGVSDFRIEQNAFGPAGEDAICIWHSSSGVIKRNQGGQNGENTIDVKDSHDIQILENLAEDDSEYNVVLHSVDQTDLTYNLTLERNHCVRGGRGGHLTAGIALLFVRNVRVKGNIVEYPFREGIFVHDAGSHSQNQILGNVIRLSAGDLRWAVALQDAPGTQVRDNASEFSPGASHAYPGEQANR